MAQPARTIPIEELAKHGDEIAAELNAGNRLEVIQGGKRIGEIVPAPPQPSEEERKAAWREMLEIMKKGLDLGGVPFTRDEMHER